MQAKILPLRLYVDQDALDFLKKFFSFSDPNSDPSSNGSSDEEIFFREYM
jgi:autophagy-related protein 2